MEWQGPSLGRNGSPRVPHLRPHNCEMVTKKSLLPSHTYRRQTARTTACLVFGTTDTNNLLLGKGCGRASEIRHVTIWATFGACLHACLYRHAARTPVWWLAGARGGGYPQTFIELYESLRVSIVDVWRGYAREMTMRGAFGSLDLFRGGMTSARGGGYPQTVIDLYDSLRVTVVDARRGYARGMAMHVEFCGPDLSCASCVHAWIVVYPAS